MWTWLWLWWFRWLGFASLAPAAGLLLSPAESALGMLRRCLARGQGAPDRLYDFQSVTPPLRVTLRR